MSKSARLPGFVTRAAFAALGLCVGVANLAAGGGAFSVAEVTWRTTFPFGGNIESQGLAVDAADPNVVYAVPSSRGLYRSTDGGLQWSSLTDFRSLPFSSESVSIVRVHPVTNALYVIAGGRVYKSLDRGESWTDRGWAPGWVRGLALHATPGILLAGTEEGLVARSTDDGANWSTVSAGLPGDPVRSLAIAPNGELYAGTAGHGVYKSADAGQTWQAANGAAPMTTIHALAVDPGNSSVVYAGNVNNPNDSDIYKTTDGGQSWIRLSVTVMLDHFGKSPGDLIAIDPLSPSNVYAVASSAVLRSADGGLSWVSASLGQFQAKALVIDATDPQRIWVGTGGEGVYRSTDGGQTWALVSSGIRAITVMRGTHNVLVDPSQPSVIYAGTSNEEGHQGGGAMRSQDGGLTWLRLTDYPINRLTSLVAHPAAPGIVYSFHNDVWRSADYGDTWVESNAGAFCCYNDGELAQHPSDPGTLYLGANGSNQSASGVHKTTNGGASWELMNTGLTDLSVHTLSIDPNDGSVLYAATFDTGSAFKTTDGALNWTPVAGLPWTSQIVAHPLDSSLLYAATRQGVYKSLDAGGTWSQVLAERAWVVAVDPTLLDVVYAYSNGVRRSEDGGVTWVAVNGGLPLPMGASSITVDPRDHNHVLLGTTAGVWEADFTLAAAPPTLSISDGSPRNVTEGDSGTTPVSFTVSLANGAGTDPVTVQYASASNSFAVAGLDFEAVSGTLTLTPPTDSQTVTVNVLGDTRGENHENFVVNLSNPIGATLVDSQGVATILNDDPPPTVAINDVMVPEGDIATRTAYFSVYLSSYFDQPISIDYATSNGTASAGSDYIAKAGSITIDPGLRSSVPIPITILEDTAVEGDETFSLTISNARYGTTPIVITRATGIGTILDDEGLVQPSTAATWTLAQEGMSTFNGIASDGSQYVLVGLYGEIWTSPNGVDWTQRSNPDRNPASGTARNLRSVTYADNRWVAVGNSDNSSSDPSRRYPIVLTSPDAVAWTRQNISSVTQNINRNLFAVAYGAGLYVAVGNPGCGPSNARTTCILTSANGASWTYRPAPINLQLNAVAFGTPSGSNRFVAVGPNRTLLTSADGIAWSQGAVPWEMPVNLNAVTWNGTQFVVVGGDASSLSPSIMTSPDGVNWTKQAVPPEVLFGFTGVSSGGGLSVAVTGVNVADPTGTSILTSPNGVDWTRRSLASIPAGVSPSLRVVGFGPAGFVAGGVRGGVYTSPDGTTPWTSRTLAASRLHNGLAFGGGIYCSAGINGAIRRSTDGVAWTQASSPPDPLTYFQWNPVTYASGRFWTAGYHQAIASSADCDAWTFRYPATSVLPTDPATGTITDLAHGPIGGNEVFVAVGQRYTTPGSTTAYTPLILSSTDGGATWVERTAVAPAGVQQTFVTVGYGNGRFVAFGMENATREQFLNVSDDGVTWTAHPTDVFDNGSFEEVNDLAYGNGLFVAVADCIRSSPDGVNWTLRQNWGSGSDYFLGVAYGSARFVAVGNSGAAYVSADGMIWTPGSTPTDHQLRAVAASSSNRIVAVGDSAVAYTDFKPTLSISDGTPRNVSEGDSGTTPVEFTVSLANGTEPVTVQYTAPNNGFALAGLDFEAVSGTLTLTPAAPSQTVTVNVLGDTRGENHENFVVNLSNPIGATLMDSQGVATILNDDPPPTVAINDVMVPEGDIATRTAYFSVALSSYFDQPITIDYATSDGEASAGSDYIDNAGSFTIDPGLRSSVPIPITIVGDTAVEGDETFSLTISNARYGATPIVITKATGTGTILDDEGLAQPSTAATWTLAQEGMSTFNGIASDGSQYVLVGLYGEIWTSPNGVDWTQRSNPDRNPATGIARNLRSVTYADNRWVAVGNFDNSDASRRYPIVLTSPDAVAWTRQDISSVTQNINRKNLFAVAYGAGLYVAVGSAGCGPSNARTTCILTSANGASWTYRPAPINLQLNGVAFGTPSGSDRFVAVGPNRTLLGSPDGIAWSQGAVPWEMPVNLNAVAWNGTQFVVVGGDASGLSPSVMTSPDGVNWTKQTVPPAVLNGFIGVGSGGGLTVAVTFVNPADPTGTSILTSPNGVDWTRQSLASIPAGVSPSLRVVGFGPAGFVAGGVRGGVYTSPDGTTPWTSRTLAASRLHNGLAFGGGIYCAVGLNGAIRRSPDGVTWTQASSPPDPLTYFQWNPVTYASGRFWTAGYHQAIASSADCDAWTFHYPKKKVLPTDPATGSITDLAHGPIGGNEVFVAVGQRYTTPGSTTAYTPLILSSIDGGATWVERTAVAPAGVQQTFVTVGYGNGRFVAFGMENATREQFLNTSDDGVTWTAHPTDVFDNGSFEEVNDLAYGKGLFVAVADCIRTSPDGINWTLRVNWPGSDYFVGVAYGSERFVGVGNSGAAYVSADGMVWTPGSTPTDHQLRAVAASSSNRIVAVGDSAVAYTDLEPAVSPPAISIADTSVAEGKASSALSFTVSLSKASAQTVTVAYSTADGTATAGSDYQAAVGTLTFLPGDTQEVLTLSVLGDSVYEGDETVHLNLSSPTNATIADSTATGTILNDDAKPALTIRGQSVAEGSSGTRPLPFTVTLTPASGVPARVSWATRNGTALAGQDYVAASGVLVFNPGETSQTITVLVNGDTTREPDETLFVDLTAPVDAVISVGTTAGTIKNDDKK